MEYSGLIEKYKVDRSLSDEERALRLLQDVRLAVEPHYQLSVIRMNSTFLESVDKWFAWRGMITRARCDHFRDRGGGLCGVR